MKKLCVILIVFLGFSSVFSQNNEVAIMPNIGDRAPEFIANTTNGEMNFPDDFFAKWKIIFSHPADFTPVCTSELLELSFMQDDFEKLNTAIMVLSTDGLNSHIEWVHSMESINYKDKGEIDIKYPLISDVGLEISRKYGMIHPKSNSTKTVRSVFIIDPDNKIRSVFIYPKSVGRNMNEIKRTLVALQKTDVKDVLTPANWINGEDLLLNSPKTVKESDKIKDKADPDLYSLAWYMWYVKE